MRAGQLRQRVTIEQKTATQDANGEETITWATWATVYAAVEPLRGEEYLAARTQQASVDTRIRLRYRDGVTTDTMRAVHDSNVYDIEAVLHIQERNRETHLMCRRQE
jgi:SPP1 family predicted phage head-tail adaptor